MDGVTFISSHSAGLELAKRNVPHSDVYVIDDKYFIEQLYISYVQYKDQSDRKQAGRVDGVAQTDKHSSNKVAPIRRRATEKKRRRSQRTLRPSHPDL